MLSCQRGGQDDADDGDLPSAGSVKAWQAVVVPGS